MEKSPQLRMEQLRVSTAPTDDVGLRSDVLRSGGEGEREREWVSEGREGKGREVEENLTIDPQFSWWR